MKYKGAHRCQFVTDTREHRKKILSWKVWYKCRYDDKQALRMQRIPFETFHPSSIPMSCCVSDSVDLSDSQHIREFHHLRTGIHLIISVACFQLALARNENALRWAQCLKHSKSLQMNNCTLKQKMMNNNTLASWALASNGGYIIYYHT